MRFIPFNSKAYDEYLQRQFIREQMRHPDFERSITAWFQPKICLETGRCTGFEALARWFHPEAGAISPMEFIPIAENTGMILPLTIKILKDTRNLLEAILSFSDLSGSFRISFNLSPVLVNSDTLTILEEWVKDTNITGNLEVEITEGIMLKTSEDILQLFHNWREDGIHFSIDDFGTGYSNLSYLQSFDADILKIDKRFIDGLPENGKNVSLVKAIILMARAFGMKIIAEGVETTAQADFLKSAGCDEVQGYLFSKPLKLEDAAAFYKSNLSAPVK